MVPSDPVAATGLYSDMAVKPATSDLFTSRWGVILAGIGMAVGTGNLWRFPRVAAENGGGAFLVPWLLALFLWSIPLLIAEFGLGRGARRGPIGAFSALVGRRTAWLGGFVVVTTVMIMFYYSVVTGWTLKYVLASLTGELAGVDTAAYWERYSTSVWQPVLFHAIAITITGAVVAAGVTRGIERANRIIMPALFVLLLAAVARAVTLPGAGRGLAYLFVPDLALLANYRTWLEALTQSAWSTGAGWGLALCYAIYVRERENVVTNAVSIGVGNNVASLLAGMAIPAGGLRHPARGGSPRRACRRQSRVDLHLDSGGVRAHAGRFRLPADLLPGPVLRRGLVTDRDGGAGRASPDGRGSDAGSRGAARDRGGRRDGVCRRRSACRCFENQDWVWGLALMISGLFIAVAAIRYDIDRFRNDLVESSPGRPRGRPPLGVGAQVPGAAGVRGDVHLVDLPGRGGHRPRGLVEPRTPVQRRDVRGAVGRRAGRPGHLQPPPGRPQPAAACYAWVTLCAAGGRARESDRIRLLRKELARVSRVLHRPPCARS